MNRGDIVSLEGVEGVYVVDVPYAKLLDVSEEQIIQEANPWAVFAFLTALVYHGLTDLSPKRIFAIQFKDGEHVRRIPLGTTPDDWAGLRLPRSRVPRKVRDTDVNWTEMKSEWDFGVTLGYTSGVPMYVTDIERTLLDAIRMPDKCGGIAKVFHGWRTAESMKVDRLIDYTDRFDIQILRQRVGFLLEKMGRTHPRLDEWRHGLQRGGSIKLVASEPYSDTYSPEWNLSLNVPPSVLAIIEQE